MKWGFALFRKQIPFLSLLSCTLLSFSSDSIAEDFEVKTAGKQETSLSAEQQERLADQAALSSQTRAIKKIKQLISKYRGSHREPILMARLAEIYQQTASLEFRIAHGKAHRSKKSVNLKKHHSFLKDCVGIISTLLKKYPNFSPKDKIYFLRGKAYEELNQKSQAKKDYLYLVKNFPEAPESILAYMSLANYAIDEANHNLAIQYLKPIEQKPESGYYPFALYKLSWAYFNLRNIPTALGYLERHIGYYKDKLSSEGLTTSDNAILDGSLQDATVFYLDGYEQKLSQYNLSSALSYFKGLESGKFLGKMISRFAKLLRSHKHNKDLIRWKDEIIEKESSRPESLDVVITTFEYLANNRRYQEVGEAASDFVKLYQINQKGIEKSESYPEAQKLLLDTAKELQKLAVRNKSSKKVYVLSRPLASVYKAFTHFVDESDPRIPGAHYNLAETLFQIKSFSEATYHYRWVLTHWKRKWKEKSKIKLEDISLKAIASRYEVLQGKKLIPTAIQAKKFSDESNSELDPLLAEWIEWTDLHASQYSKRKDWENFIFEANRSLYYHNKVQLSVDRLSDFAVSRPKSKFAIPSASLVLDTLVKSENWVQTYEKAHKLMKVKSWNKKDFQEKLYALAATSFYKTIEIAKNEGRNEDVLDRADDFIKTYKKSDRMEDTLFMAANTALKMEKRKKSESYFNQLIKEFPTSTNTPPAILTLATQAEDSYRFDTAVNFYEKYLGLSEKQNKLSKSEKIEFQKKIFKLLWLDGEMKKLLQATKDHPLCKNELYETCTRYSLLAKLHLPSQEDSKTLVKNALKGPKSIRPFWALLALKNQEKMAFPDRMLLVRIIMGKWDHIDSLEQYSLIPMVNEVIPKAFELNRAAINRYSQLQASQKSIQRRIGLIQEMETTATRVAKKLPWARIKARVLNEIAYLYLDFTQSISTLPVPKNLSAAEQKEYQSEIQKIVLPFEEKGHDIRRTAFEVASQASIERNELEVISSPFFANNPSQAKALMGDVESRSAKPVSIAVLEYFDGENDWDDLKDDDYQFYENPANYGKSQWIKALMNKKWQLAAYFLQETRRHQWMKDASLVLAKAISLSAVGAQSEGLAELREAVSLLQGEKRIQMLTYLITHSLASYSQKITKALLEDLVDLLEKGDFSDAYRTRDEAFALAFGADWSGAKIPEESQVQLLKKAQRSSNAKQRDWAKKKLKLIAQSRKIANQNTDSSIQKKIN